MNLNYHELTMEEPKDSPAKKKQFAIICSVIAAVASYQVMTSGVLLPIEPTKGVFPGGNFCYKLATRDYAASMGLGRMVMDDLIGEKAKGSERRPIEENIYHLFLDDPALAGGRRQRWATGLLVGDSGMDQVKKLRAQNDPKHNPVTEDDDEAEKRKKKKKQKKKRYPTEKELLELGGRDILTMYPYELVDLPSVDSLVVQFPHTHGFVSALVQSYKIIPALRKMAQEKGGEGTFPLVISTCQKSEDMCTYYAPLLQTKDFLLGQMDTTEFLAGLPAEHFLDWEGFKQGGRKVFPFAAEYIDMLP